MSARTGLASLMIAAGVAAAPAAQAQIDFAKSEYPYASIMIPTPGGPLSHWPSPEELTRIAHTFGFVNSHSDMIRPESPDQERMAFWAGPSGGVDEQGRTLGQLIKAINPEFVLSNYRNGSYIQQNCPEEAREVEEGFALGIAVHDSKLKLAEPLDESASSIILQREGAPPKSSFPAIYPLIVSTTEEPYSKTKEEYVAWIRLGDEVLRINAAEGLDGNRIRIDAVRGYWGTQAAAHDVETVVLLPVYIGATQNIDAPDGALSGRPGADAPQIGLRYALQQQDPKFHEWLATKCKRTFDEGYDVAWLDVSVSTWYNNANPYGENVIPWDIENNKPIDNPTYRERQQIKFDALFERFPGKLFFVNNVKGSVYFDHGQDKRLLSGEEGHHPVSGGSMEMYANTRNPGQWRQIADMTLDFVHSGYWGVAWAKGGRGEYWKFAYATYLLAHEPDARLHFAPGEGNTVFAELADYLYWDLGIPFQHFQKVDEARRSDAANVYQRRFENGLVVVNAGGEATGDLALDAEMLNPATGEMVGSIQLQPWTAAILMHPKSEGE